MRTFPTTEELNEMTIKQLKSLDIQNAQEEGAVQAVLDTKLQDAPIEHQVFRGDIPDIKTKEDEEKWQKIIDDREASHRPQDHVEETEVDLNKMPPIIDVPSQPEQTPVETEEVDADEDVEPPKTEEELEAEIADLENKKAEITS